MSQKITSPFTSSSSLPQQQQQQYGLILTKSKKPSTQLNSISTSSNPINDVNLKKANTPILSKGKTSYNEDIQSCPDSSSLDDYKNVPVSLFGLRMLKDLGWKEGQSLGQSSKNSLLKPIEYIPRPNLLGLGADPSLPSTSTAAPSLKRKSPDYVLPQTKEGKRKYTKSIDEPLKIKETLQVQSRIQIFHGIHAGLLGQVKEFISSTSKVKIQLNNGEEVMVPLSYVQLVSELEPRPSSIQPSSSIPYDTTLIHTLEPPWIHPGLRVRMISKTFQHGMFYNKKAYIVDVLPGNLALLQFDKEKNTPKFIDQVPQSYLETVIPSVGEKVMIVKTATTTSSSLTSLNQDPREDLRVGSVAKLLMKNKHKQECVCALEEDESLVYVLTFDQICEVKN